MTDYQYGLPQDDPGRIPDRPLPQQKPANTTPAPQAIPERKLSAEPAPGQAESTPLPLPEGAPQSVSVVEEQTAEAVTQANVQAPAYNSETEPAAAFGQSIAPTQASAYPQSIAPAQAIAPAQGIAPAQSIDLQQPPEPAPSNAPPAGESPASTGLPTGSAKPAAKDKPARNWADLKLLAKYYLTVVNEVVFTPSKLFAQATASTDLVEPAVFMAISIGICSILQVVSGDMGGIFRFIGKIFCVLASAFIATYGMKALASKGDFATLFKIFAYSQAPMIIGWIKLGALPIGGMIAVGYSMYLSIIGLEQAYRIQRTQAAFVVVIVGLIAWGIAKLLMIL